MNTFVYVTNNPINWIDSYGMLPGDPFRSAEAAAIDAMQYSHQKSRETGLEWGGYITKISTGVYTYEEPTSGSSDAWSESQPGADDVAGYHSHPGLPAEYESEKYSVHDYIWDAIHKMIGYLITPCGDMWRNDDLEGPPFDPTVPVYP